MVKIRKRHLIGGIIVLLLTTGAVLFFGFVPVLVVDGHAVNYTEFLKVHGAFRSYDRIMQKTPASSEELTRRALAKLIEDRVLDMAIQKTNAALHQKASEVTERAVLEHGESDIDAATKQLYGLSAADFKRIVLLPQAKVDLLEKHYEYNPSELDRLWKELMTHADVKIYYPGYKWEDGEIKVRD